MATIFNEQYDEDLGTWLRWETVNGISTSPQWLDAAGTWQDLPPDLPQEE